MARMHAPNAVASGPTLLLLFAIVLPMALASKRASTVLSIVGKTSGGRRIGIGHHGGAVATPASGWRAATASTAYSDSCRSRARSSSAAFASSLLARRGCYQPHTPQPPRRRTRGASLSFLLSHPPSEAPAPSSRVDAGGGAAYHATANQQLVARRNEVSRRKREARQAALDRDRARNLRLRRRFQEEGREGTDGAGAPPALFAVKVVACPALRAELKMNGREKRGRMFMERPAALGEEGAADAGEEGSEGAGDGACTSLRALRQTLHEFFRRLKKSTYLLAASLPTLDEEGNVLTAGVLDDGEPDDAAWPLRSDDDVRRAFLRAEDHFRQHRAANATSVLKRPTLVLHVTQDPDAPAPPPPPAYLLDMPDPRVSPTVTMLSFYAFPPRGLADPEAVAAALRRRWRPFRARGRVYVAAEGVNAQMAVATNVLSQFRACVLAEDGDLADALGRHVENGVNVDPVAVGAEEFARRPAFRTLHVRVRSQVVADGLEAPLDWGRAGYDMPPLEWHARLKGAREAQRRTGDGGDEGDGKGEDADADAAPPIVLDCRNDYESRVGRFELAEPLGTDNFRDSWDALEERLRDVPKDAPIMTYCTGGIRCVKVAAYLTQNLRFTNVSRLAGGVVAYDRTLREAAPADEEPMFKGVNYVFDDRMGRRITEDQLGTCETCGRKTHLVSNCKNSNCHKRMVQCEYCHDSFFGTCSEACKTRVVNEGMGSPIKDKNPVEDVFSLQNEDEQKVEEVEAKMTGKEHAVYATLDGYSSAHSTPTAALLLREIEANTAALIPSGAHMVSGSAQGGLLTTLAALSRGGRVLEIGTFSGYATACLLEGAAAAGRCAGVAPRDEGGAGARGGPFVLSLERDRRALGLAAAHLRVMTEFGTGEEGAKQARELRSDVAQDFVGDSISFTYNNLAGCELLRVNDALATLEEMASDIDNPIAKQYAPFDIVFVDADKTRLTEYVEALVSDDRVLKKGGLILVDNVLWKGLVLDAASGGGGDPSGTSPDHEGLPPSTRTEKELLKKSRRARKLANKMHRFNSAVAKDDRVEVLMMNLRDGLSMIRKC